jgi:hypothetical protein
MKDGLSGNYIVDPEVRKGLDPVREEVVRFFRDHPFLLVSEGRLAVLLCRPVEMVVAAVNALEREGFLFRKGEETLLCAEGCLVEAKTT